ncbi:nucleoside hydrolase [Candidatus Bathyarchaeota archaeon]|nr:nucleoside hydrolase [Candidatus Bathyarchaeota archaeon]
MDGGIDDALALILALRSPEIQVEGITSVSGNVPVEQATQNALRVVELLDRPDVWVAEGLTRPLSRDPIRAYNFHGKDGLGNSHSPKPKLRAKKKNALTAINETLSSSNQHEITIICTGPLTNLASLLKESHESRKMIREAVIMGGAYGITKHGIGNETPVAEFNVYSDPEAAKIVFETGVPLSAVGLDVTTIPDLELDKADYSRLIRKKGNVARFAARILQTNMRAHGRFTLHDPMAVAAKIRPGYYRFEDYRVRVETSGDYTTGMTVVDRRYWLPETRLLGRRVKVCQSVDPRFKRLFLDRIMAE